MNNARQDILKTLAYFDYFNYPLSHEEICSFLPARYNQSLVTDTLFILTENETIFKIDNFYSLQNDCSLVKKRLEGNQRAMKQLAIAKKVAKILSLFPYVESISVSGSLSKYYADEKADIDFFIITSANRLWIARTCMHLLKKLSYLAGKQDWFCMNYYVDEIGREINEKNVFTAMEIVTLLPMQGISEFKKFISKNAWTNDFFPPRVSMPYIPTEIKRGFFRGLFESIFNSNFGDHIDKWLMQLTARRWEKKKKNEKRNSHGARIGMVVNRHFSKPDPKNFQVKVIQQYEKRVKQLMESDELIKVAL